jgi:hypothetical protein
VNIPSATQSPREGRAGRVRDELDLDYMGCCKRVPDYSRGKKKKKISPAVGAASACI